MISSFNPPIVQHHGRHGQLFSSKTRGHNELLLCRNDVWEILYKISIFRADHTNNMAVFVCDLQIIKFSLKPFGQIK
jgi:hypothetical protein